MKPRAPTSSVGTFPTRKLSALIAGVAFLGVAAAVFVTAPGTAQVLAGQPYAPAPDPAMERLESRLNTLEADVRRVTGQNEQLSFQLSNARRAADEANAGRQQLQRDYDALSARLSALEAMARGDTAAAASVAREPGAATVDLTNGPAGRAEAASGAAIDAASLPADEEGLLKEARNLLLAGDYPSAHSAFSRFLKEHPRSASADEAQYLLGESLLYQGAYADAATEYGKLLSSYEKSERGPEALVKLARSMRLMDKKSEACKALGLMNSRFPKASNAAKTLAATERSRAGC